MTTTKTRTVRRKDYAIPVSQATWDAWKLGLEHGKIVEMVDYYKDSTTPISPVTISAAKNSGKATDRVRRLINNFLGLENDLYK